ncbi:MAG: asparagine synthase (glutamine-hydrolyzing) [Myxacorys chilensis ATA2-1-KO14]|jgi:asparagine synthase (glutamine-hydrolysing)|nr:asparagine synthase (glutamine-hydrolyzing) [Myxacorys chilensis ATA2-1-KO14]
MCGIAGIITLGNGPPPDLNVALRMAEAIRHRGPDGHGYYSDNYAAMAVRRLAIVARRGGDQPIRSGSQTLIANGEVYDYVAQRERLRAAGAVFTGESDVEVLLHLLADGDPSRLIDVNGQFALALWDREARRLLLARDHFGIAPLFYAECNGALIFGSEIKALLQYPDLDRTLDPAGLDQVATFPGLVSPTTMFRHVRSLPPGSYLVADRQGVRVQCYWDLDYPLAEATDRSDECLENAYVAELARLLDAATERRLQGEAEVGLLLSGGLDSSMIGGILRRLHPEHPIRAYSAVFPGRTFDESRFQRAAAAASGLTLTQVSFDTNRIVDALSDMIAHAECPVRESYNVCSLVLARAARNDSVTVLLGGEGADELFAGYPGYYVDVALHNNRPLFTESGSVQGNWGNAGLRYEREYDDLARKLRGLYSGDIRRELAQENALDVTQPCLQALRGRHVQHQRSYLDVKLRLADHLLGDHGDRMMYASGVEARFPFLDKDLVTFVRTIPPQINLKNGVEKYLLRRVAERDLPRPLRERRKYGFRAPGTNDLLLDERVRAWLSPHRIRHDGWFDPAAVASLVSKAEGRQNDLNPHVEDDLLMIVLSFNIFLDAFHTANNVAL